MASLTYNIHVDASQPLNMMARVAQAVSPPSLARFLENETSDYLFDQIQARILAGGDDVTGKWPELSDATVRIREAYGFPGSWPKNWRTGEMMRFVSKTNSVTAGPGGVELQIPGDTNDSVMEQKIGTAQKGRTTNPLPNCGPTPPRPILALDDVDAGYILERLEAHIIDEIIGGFA
mgnify:FL=1